MDDKTQALIEKPFALEEHGFLEKGGYYILKSAIRQRLNQVSGGKWHNTPPEILHMEEDLVTMRGGLVLFGETRYAVGTGIIERTRLDKDKKEILLSSYQISRNKAKAMKTAPRDLLPRAALEHGIGEYLRDMPKKVREACTGIDGPKAFAEWLDQQHKAWAHRWPTHWALNGGGMTVKALMSLWEIPWQVVAAQIEPGRLLTKMSDTSLSLVEFIARLGIITTQIALQQVQPQSTDDKILSQEVAATS